MKLYTFTNQGIKKTENEDGVFSMSGEGYLGSYHAIAVADGMGGYEEGKINSGIAIRYLNDFFSNNKLGENYEIILENIDLIFKKIDESIKEKNSKCEKKGGTTLTLALLYDNKILVKNIGDTRCYKINKKNIKQLNEDHAIFNYDGKKTSVLTHCLGMGSFINPYTYIEEYDGSTIMIASDGFYSHQNEKELIFNTLKTNDPNDFQSVLDILFSRGEKDNVSMVKMVGEKRWITIPTKNNITSICPQCGKSLEENACFCHHCGTKLNNKKQNKNAIPIIIAIISIGLISLFIYNYAQNSPINSLEQLTNERTAEAIRSFDEFYKNLIEAVTTDNKENLSNLKDFNYFFLNDMLRKDAVLYSNEVIEVYLPTIVDTEEFIYFEVKIIDKLTTIDGEIHNIENCYEIEMININNSWIVNRIDDTSCPIFEDNLFSLDDN